LCRLQTHTVKPDAIIDYRDLCAEYLPGISARGDIPMSLLASFKFWYGDNDKCLHVWKYEANEYTSHKEVHKKLNQLPEFLEFKEKRQKMLISQQNDLVFEFSFWPAMQPCDRNSIYELRSYRLHPGTMWQFAAEWNDVMQYQIRQDRAVAGFFSDIGTLNMVYYIWAYDNLEHRQSTRNQVWEGEHGQRWTNVVASTQKLCAEMNSAILKPMDFSPTK